MECEAIIIPGKKGRHLFMQQSPLEILPQEDSVKLSPVERDRNRSDVARRYLQGNMPIEEYYNLMWQQNRIGTDEKTRTILVCGVLLLTIVAFILYAITRDTVLLMADGGVVGISMVSVLRYYFEKH
jgi:hypothetical protein